MINLLLVILAVLLFIILEPISFVYVVLWKKRFKWSRITGYWFSLAINIDRFGNYEFRSLFNAILITSEGYQFGDFRETISSVIGKNKQAGTLSALGRILDNILDLIDKNHSIKSIHIFDEKNKSHCGSLHCNATNHISRINSELLEKQFGLEKSGLSHHCKA